MMMDEGQERVKASYGDNYARLTKVKSQYDPDNPSTSTRTSSHRPRQASGWGHCPHPLPPTIR